MTVRSDRLWGPVLIPGAGRVNVYTVPAGFRALVKEVVVNNTSAVGSRAVSIAVNGTSAADFIIWSTGLIPTSSAPLRFAGSFWVLLSGDTISLGASGEGMTCWGFGAELQMTGGEV